MVVVWAGSVVVVLLAVREVLGPLIRKHSPQ